MNRVLGRTLAAVAGTTVAATVLLAPTAALAHHRGSSWDSSQDAEQDRSGPVIDTILGTGDAFNGGDGQPAQEASVSAPQDVATAPDGTVYVLAGLQVRAIDPQTQRVSTIAGTGSSGFSGDGGPATGATFSAKGDLPAGARGLAVGPDGTIYVADAGNHRIRAINPKTSTIRTVAGHGKTGFKGSSRPSNDDKPATEARLWFPKDVAVDTKGNLYIADVSGIRRVSAQTGKIQTIAGDVAPGESETAATATFVDPDSVAVGNDDTVYFAETLDDRVRAVDVAKDRITTLANVDMPDGLAVSTDNRTLYIAGKGTSNAGANTVFGYDLKKQRMHRFAGGGDRPMLGDGGKPTEATISSTRGIAANSDGEFYVADSANNRVRVVRDRKSQRPVNHRASKEQIRTLIGSGKVLDEQGEEELHERENRWYYRDEHALDSVDLDNPDDVTVDSDGTLYISEFGTDRIRAVAPDDGVVRTIAGRLDPPNHGANTKIGGDATDAYLNKPRSLAVADDKLYFLDDSIDGAVGVVDLDKETIGTALDSSVELDDPRDLAVADDGTTYVLDKDKLCRLRPAKNSCETVVAGNWNSHVPEGKADFHDPGEIAVGPDGRVYVADNWYASYSIRAVQPQTGKISTIAGKGLSATATMRPSSDRGLVYRSGDGAQARSASLGAISGLTVGEDGWLYFTDQAFHRVRAIHLKTNTIRAVAGTGGGDQPKSGDAGPPHSNDGIGVDDAFEGGGFAGDGGAARDARLDNPGDVAIGPNGELYLADAGNNRIRIIGDTDIEPTHVIHPLLWGVGGLLLIAVLAGTALAYRWIGRKRRDTYTAADRADESSQSTTGGHHESHDNRDGEDTPLGNR